MCLCHSYWHTINRQKAEANNELSIYWDSAKPKAKPQAQILSRTNLEQGNRLLKIVSTNKRVSTFAFARPLWTTCGSRHVYICVAKWISSHEFSRNHLISICPKTIATTGNNSQTMPIAYCLFGPNYTHSYIMHFNQRRYTQTFWRIPSALAWTTPVSLVGLKSSAMPPTTEMFRKILTKQKRTN